MSHEQEVSAVVFKQFSLHWKEIIKSAVIAGLTITVSLIYVSLQQGEWPTLPELKSAANNGLMAMAGAVIRYFLNPTMTVVKGQIEPDAKVVAPGTAIVKNQPMVDGK